MNGVRRVESDEETCPSSIMRRFHRICNRGETSGDLHWQFGTREPENSGHLHVFQLCNLVMLDLRSSSHNP